MLRYLAKLCAALAVLALLASPAAARHRSSGGYHVSHRYTSTSYSHHRAVGVARDRHGRIARSAKAKDAFKRLHPCPATGKSYGACKGYVIDHIQALKHGGADDPANLQWQTTEDAKAKDKLE